MEQVRYGIIGLGNQGSTYNWSIFDKGQAKDAVVTAMCDIDPQKIEIMKSKTTNENAVYFTDYKEMLDSGLVDAVLVETPHYLHPEIVMESLKRGIHALCDKPAGVYTKQVREMNEAAEKANCLFGMMFNQRTNCVYRKMREMIQNGDLGEIQRITWIITSWFRNQSYYDSGQWRATWEGEGGGVLINQSPHQLDLIQWVTGMTPKAVHGFCKYGHWHDVEVEDEVTAYLEYENGATGVFITTTGEAPGTNRFEISGTKGKLVFEMKKGFYFYKLNVDSKEHLLNCEDPHKPPKAEAIQVEHDGENPQHKGIINNFTAAILGQEPLFVKGTDGIKMVELMNAIELSGWHGGERVTLPVDEDRYLAELNEHRAKSRVKEAVEAKVVNTSGSYEV
ncbi:MAG: Gfo/Idh/MocA family oxidoreductase [Clostridia bacterium]|nr:Gfo/Idh/MocA family oxidoreductase [Clostridia bacterium]